MMKLLTYQDEEDLTFAVILSVKQLLVSSKHNWIWMSTKPRKYNTALLANQSEDGYSVRQITGILTRTEVTGFPADL